MKEESICIDKAFPSQAFCDNIVVATIVTHLSLLHGRHSTADDGLTPGGDLEKLVSCGAGMQGQRETLAVQYQAEVFVYLHAGLQAVKIRAHSCNRLHNFSISRTTGVYYQK